MKRRFVILLLVFTVLSLSARPQFFVGGGVEWGRIHPSTLFSSALEGNERYYSGDFTYAATLVPKVELTVLPYADVPVGLTCDFGYGFVTGVNRNGSTSSSYDYRYGSDGVLHLSGALTYIHLARSEKYFSVSGTLGYSWNRYTLSKNGTERGKKAMSDDTVINQHTVSVGVGMIGRYDAQYFSLSCELGKDMDFEKGISSLWSGKGYSFTVSMSFGCVFTLLNQNQFMR